MRWVHDYRILKIWSVVLLAVPVRAGELFMQLQPCLEVIDSDYVQQMLAESPFVTAARKVMGER